MEKMLRDARQWEHVNFAVCTEYCLRDLLTGLKQDHISEVFFPNVNLLDRVDNEAKAHCQRELEKKMVDFDYTSDISLIFENARQDRKARKASHSEIVFSDDSSEIDHDLDFFMCKTSKYMDVIYVSLFVVYLCIVLILLTLFIRGHIESLCCAFPRNFPLMNLQQFICTVYHFFDTPLKKKIYQEMSWNFESRFVNYGPITYGGPWGNLEWECVGPRSY